MADDGIRYLDPEVSLLFKALAAPRSRTRIDLDNVWPLLDDGAAGLAARGGAPYPPGPPVAGAARRLTVTGLPRHAVRWWVQ